MPPQETTRTCGTGRGGGTLGGHGPEGIWSKMIDVSMIKANLAPRSFPVKRKINSTNAFPCLLSRCHPHDKVVPPAPRPPGMPAQAYSLDPQWAAVREHYRHYLQTLLTLTGTGPRAAAGCPLSFSSLFFCVFFLSSDLSCLPRSPHPEPNVCRR